MNSTFLRSKWKKFHKKKPWFLTFFIFIYISRRNFEKQIPTQIFISRIFQEFFVHFLSSWDHVFFCMFIYFSKQVILSQCTLCGYLPKSAKLDLFQLFLGNFKLFFKNEHFCDVGPQSLALFLKTFISLNCKY